MNLIRTADGNSCAKMIVTSSSEDYPAKSGIIYLSYLDILDIISAIKYLIKQVLMNLIGQPITLYHQVDQLILRSNYE